MYLLSDLEVEFVLPFLKPLLLQLSAPLPRQLLLLLRPRQQLVRQLLELVAFQGWQLRSRPSLHLLLQNGCLPVNFKCWSLYFTIG